MPAPGKRATGGGSTATPAAEAFPPISAKLLLHLCSPEAFPLPRSVLVTTAVLRRWARHVPLGEGTAKPRHGNSLTTGIVATPGGLFPALLAKSSTDVQFDPVQRVRRSGGARPHDRRLAGWLAA